MTQIAKYLDFKAKIQGSSKEVRNGAGYRNYLGSAYPS